MVLVALVDQLSKIWIKTNIAECTIIPCSEEKQILWSFIKFTHVKNKGMAFGIDVGELGWLVTVLSFAATIFIVYIHWQERFNHPLIVTGLTLILGGAIGNLIDRSAIFWQGRNYEGVVDFLNIGVGAHRWYFFNVADAAVTIGIILCIIHEILIHKAKLVKNNV